MRGSRNSALTWGLVGSILNLTGIVLLIVSLAGDIGSWAPLAFGSLISIGAACGVIRPRSEHTHE